jgi:hypothetical protein
MNKIERVRAILAPGCELPSYGLPPLIRAVHDAIRENRR